MAGHCRLVMCDAAVACSDSENISILQACQVRRGRGPEIDCLEANGHSARERRVLLRACELLVEHRVCVARGLARGVEVLPPVREVSIDVVPMSEIVRDGD